MTAQLILIAAALIGLPAFIKIVRVLIDLVAKILAAGFVLGLTLLALAALASHGRLI